MTGALPMPMLAARRGRMAPRFVYILALAVMLGACARGATPPDPLDRNNDTGAEDDTADTPADTRPADMGGEPDTEPPPPDTRDEPDTPACDTPFYPDNDEDGHGDAEAEPTLGCEAPEGFVRSSDDCDDEAASVYAGATETAADGQDQDCDGQELCYVDADNDGVRAEPLATQASSDLTCGSDGLATADAPQGDCDDNNPDLSTPAQEVCNGVDDDCNGIVDDGDTCPCPAAGFEGKIYLFCDDGSSWPQAQIFCQREGLHLAKVESVAENEFITARAIQNGMDETWIGLNDRDTGGEFVWHDGTALAYENWNPGQPNNGDGGDQDCTEIHTCVNPDSCQDNSWVGRWNDEDCNAPAAFVCESP
jgi:hypothetical protein